MTVVLPHVFKDNVGEAASGVQVDENFNALVAALEGIATAAAGTDVYQAGVLASTDWPAPAGSTNEATGEAETANTFGGAAWLPGPVSGLVRTFTVAQVWKLKPPVLPAESGFMKVGIELTASGAAATVSLVCGAEQASEALAIANPPAVSAGKTRVWDYVLRKEGGKYKTSAARDRRPWSRGAYATATRTTGDLAVPAGTEAITALTQRVECSGVPVRLTFNPQILVPAGGVVALGFRMDGAKIGLVNESVYHSVGAPAAGALEHAPEVAYEFTPAAGSHLFAPTMKCTTAGGEIRSSAAIPLQFTVQELLRPSANNGTT